MSDTSIHFNKEYVKRVEDVVKQLRVGVILTGVFLDGLFIKMGSPEWWLAMFILCAYITYSVIEQRSFQRQVKGLTQRSWEECQTQSAQRTRKTTTIAWILTGTFMLLFVFSVDKIQKCILLVPFILASIFEYRIVIEVLKKGDGLKSSAG